MRMRSLAEALRAARFTANALPAPNTNVRRLFIPLSPEQGFYHDATIYMEEYAGHRSSSGARDLDHYSGGASVPDRLCHTEHAFHLCRFAAVRLFASANRRF